MRQKGKAESNIAHADMQLARRTADQEKGVAELDHRMNWIPTAKTVGVCQKDST